MTYFMEITKKGTAILLAIAMLITSTNTAFASTNAYVSTDNVKAKAVLDKARMVDQDGNEVTLKAGTIIELEVVSRITTANMNIGDEVDFRVTQNVTVDGKVVISQGSKAYGRVTKYQKRKMFGRPGMIEVKVDKVITESGDYIYVDGNGLSNEGKDKKVISWVIFGVSLIILWPLIFVPFFIKGKDGAIMPGEKIRVRTSQKNTIILE